MEQFLSLPPGSPYWGNGFLPSVYQGTFVRDKEPRILNLDPPPHLKGEAQERNLGLLGRLNRLHQEDNPADTDLDARIASYELAARMQTAAKDVLDLSGETEETKRLYGLDDPLCRKFGEVCLIARRLVERGVRFVQVWNHSWDHHEEIYAEGRHPRACRLVDKPSAGLVTDLKRRGLLDTTLVHWGGEMGRLPVIQYAGPDKKPGRDHNTDGFSTWLAGGGVRAGHVHGRTDDFGLRAVEGAVSHHDFHATLLHLFGLDPKKLVFAQKGRDLSLVEGRSGRVVREILS